MKKVVFLLTSLLVSVCWGQEKEGICFENDGVMYRITKPYIEGNEHGDIIVTYWDSTKVGSTMSYNIEKKYEGIMIIPSSIKYGLDNGKHTYRVVGIDNHCFEGCKNLIYVMLSDFVGYIGKRAFYNCDWLQVADLYSGTYNMFIGDEAFSGCKHLLYIDIKGNPTFGHKVFVGCDYIKEIYTRGIDGDKKGTSYPIDMFEKPAYSSAKVIHYGGKSPKEFYKRNDCWQEFRYSEFKKEGVNANFAGGNISSTNFQNSFYYILTGDKFQGRSINKAITAFDKFKMKDSNKLFSALSISYNYW